MLADNIKTQIRDIYKTIGQSLPQFRPRKEQNYLVAEIAKTLAGEYDKQRRIIVAEAGTGIGKSLSYILGTIPLALAMKKKVCIATATVALQEQLLHKDLPFFAQHSGLDFKFGLVKGRQRYVCLSKLEMLIGDSAGQGQQAMWVTKPDPHQVQLLQDLLSDYQQKKWNGERDTLTRPLPDHLWYQIASDKHSCHRQHASHRDCPFHKAREDVETWDVLIANHSLLLADLELGGGIILPDPEELFYVIDEAHHLPTVARDFSSAQTNLRGAIDWLEKSVKFTEKLQKQLKSNQLVTPAMNLQEQIDGINVDLKQMLTLCEAQTHLFNNPESRWRFENGQIPEQLRAPCQELNTAGNLALKHFNKIQALIQEAMKEGELPSHQADSLMGESGIIVQRLENFAKLWKSFAKEDNPKGAPLARWIERLTPQGKPVDYLFCSSPIEVGFMLESMLWEKAAGVVLCSATLRALNQFSHFAHQVGLSMTDGSRYLTLQSPFDFQNNATLYLPKMNTEPTEEAYTAELAQFIVKLTEDEDATLVLFTSYWQMEKVHELVKNKIKTPILVQGTSPRQTLLDTHKKRCDNHQASIIFGTGSFSEGLDLPGDYLTNLIVTKLPFAVPTSPVEQAHAEYIKSKGGNPFMQITIPDASRKLIQSCGRLLRKEQDSGRITILDRRLVTKRYGSALLDSLPPYGRQIEY